VAAGGSARVAVRTPPSIARDTPGDAAARKAAEAEAAARRTDVYTYERGEFGGRFDGIINGPRHVVTLRIGLQFEDQGKPEGKDERIATFAARAKGLIEQNWSGVHGLRSVCHGGLETFSAKVQIDTNSKNPHHVINVWPVIAGERSKSTEWQQDDLATKDRVSPVPDAKGKPVDRTFHQVTALHEFGHLIGLQHILCASDADRCYGVTAAQKSDIMGYSSIISRREYQPFVDILSRYGRDTLPPTCNTWKLVEAG
jgi:hypothetical protein